MKNFKVKALIEFDDIEEKCHRNIEEQFYVNEERYNYLSSKNAVMLIGIDKIEEKTEEKKVTKTTKKSKK